MNGYTIKQRLITTWNKDFKSFKIRLLVLIQNKIITVYCFTTFIFSNKLFDH